MKPGHVGSSALAMVGACAWLLCSTDVDTQPWKIPGVEMDARPSAQARRGVELMSSVRNEKRGELGPCTELGVLVLGIELGHAWVWIHDELGPRAPCRLPPYAGPSSQGRVGARRYLHPRLAAATVVLPCTFTHQVGLQAMSLASHEP
ncbi:hypothetical protein Dimus_020703 [Dionaea muscipula]